MTPDQIYAIKRVLLLEPDALAELRMNMQLHDNAIAAIQKVFDPRRDAEATALDAMTKIHEDILHNKGRPA